MKNLSNHESHIFFASSRLGYYHQLTKNTSKNSNHMKLTSLDLWQTNWYLHNKFPHTKYAITTKNKTMFYDGSKLVTKSSICDEYVAETTSVSNINLSQCMSQ